MELDLNREEPLDQIEERIRRLEAVIFRARQRQRWRQSHTPIQITNFAGELVTTANVHDRVNREEVGIGDEEMLEGGRTGKRKATYLISKALEEQTYTNFSEGCAVNLFDCNICLDMARDPILTCCGHLFCWPCFGKLSYAYSNAKECPVCNGEVTEEGIIPIYGSASGNSGGLLELNETGLRVPARPHAPRVESVRQRLRNWGASTVQDTPRIGNYFGGLGEPVQLEIPYGEIDRANVLATQYHQETENDQHGLSHQFSRLLVQGASSIASHSLPINSAMDSTQQLFEEELETYNRSPLGSSGQLNHHSVNRDSPFSITATNQSGSHTRDVAATSFAASSSVSSLSRNNGINAVTDSNIQTTDDSMQIISSSPSASSRTDLIR